jgi:hypothetical protein
MFTLPIAVDQLQVLAAGEAKASIDRQTGQQRTDAAGKLLYDLPAVFMGDAAPRQSTCESRTSWTAYRWARCSRSTT